MPPKRTRSGTHASAPAAPPLRLLHLPPTPAGLTQADLDAPCDALAATLLLRAQFPAGLAVGDRPCPPILLGSQVGALVARGDAASPGGAAGELAGLAGRRILRPLRLPALAGCAGGPASVAEAWVFEGDLAEAAASALRRAGGGGGGGAEAAVSAARALLAACPGPGLTHARLVAVLTRALGGCGGREGGGESDDDDDRPCSSASSGDSLAHHPSLAGAAAVAGGGRGSAARPCLPPPPAVDAALAALLRVGVLARAVTPASASSSSSSYLFSIPGGGGARFVRGVAAGRAALVGALRRRRGGVAPMPPAGARVGGGPAAAALDARFVVRDCVGGGWVVRLDGPAGVMLRLGEAGVRDGGGGGGGGRGRGR